ncbi:sensor histidine kinase [Nonomuraea aurantiaca]|jgi:two-component system sensor histidine kinase DesK|uniref:sensor histidine kinase n=1 Tax=Nonomuraea aurantiaca TaxID=2878562 RepID=UPI001CD92F09|nr:histidine kinase [Nonomuraea aurantiaca]MCA2220128.1 histidine kinase [Nonomuraea aurantiaca]
MRAVSGGRFRGASRVRLRQASLVRLRRASRLDKVRWLIVYTADVANLLALLGLFELYVRWSAGFPAALTVGAAVLLLVLLGLATRPFRIAVRGGRRPTGLLVVAGVITLPLVVLALVWAIPVWLGMLAPFVRRRTILVLGAGSIVVLNTYVTLAAGFQIQVLLVQTIFTGLVTGGVLVNLWLWRVARDAHEGQEARARIAVSEERLRFARDLNDLLGQSLADISARAGAASLTLREDPSAAAGEMFEVRDLARQTLREVRSTVQSYRAVDLDEVLASVRAVLEAADVRCVVRADTVSLTAETRTLLATVVREGATNILKHSKAGHCTITIEGGVLEMSNDGVDGPVNDHAPDGLGGLSQRVSAAGGTLSAARTDDGAYLLRAAVPA